MGVVDVTISPPCGVSSTPAQSLVEGHETALNRLVEATPVWRFHADAPPAGLVDDMELPSLSTAIQNDVEGQDTALITAPEPEPTNAADHVLAAPVGSVEVTTWPALSTATQSVVEGHDIP